MVLVDTSVWVEHLRRGESRLAALLEETEVLCHPFVIGEIACGHLRNRTGILELLKTLPSVDRESDGEVLEFIERNRLQGKGLGLIDVHLLASCVKARQPLWTLDARLGKSSAVLGQHYP